MQTNFSITRLADPQIKMADQILRACVHCGFCTATCPTYGLLGDERDSPRGRIYLIKEMLEADRPADPVEVRHIDRCLTCLSCMTTCPSGVHYAHLVDHARHHIAETFRRPLYDRLLRRALALILPYPRRMRWALLGAAPARIMVRWLPRSLASYIPVEMAALLRLAPPLPSAPSFVDRPQTFPADGVVRKRVVLMTGCAQQVLAPAINEATVRLLTRHGVSVVVAEGAGCCGALVHHLGETERAQDFAKRQIDAWERVRIAGGLDAVIINTSGCGTTVKDYGHLLRGDPDYAEPAARIAGLARDITEFMDEIGLHPPVRRYAPPIAYHAACSLYHGQQIKTAPKRLLAAAGFTVKEPRDSHLCCGSAGTYNILQPALAEALRAEKQARLRETGATLVAAGNIGCLTQIAHGAGLTTVHTVELLDWATGGPVPACLTSAHLALMDESSVYSSTELIETTGVE